MKEENVTQEIWDTVTQSRRQMLAVLTMYQNSYSPVVIGNYIASLRPEIKILDLITSLSTLILTFIDYQAQGEAKRPEEILQEMALAEENLTLEQLVEWMEENDDDR